MMMTTMDDAATNSLVADFFDAQFAEWPEVKSRYLALGDCRRKTFDLGKVSWQVQFNPSRAISTGARTDAESISKRPCFLCAENRPEQQFEDRIGDFDVLVNPFPIFPVHLTVASVNHQPQSLWPAADMIGFVSRLPSLCAFYNGAKAGASAPDHLHFQAVNASELPLLQRIGVRHDNSEPGIRSSAKIDPDFPFLYYSALIPDNEEGMKLVLEMAAKCGIDIKSGKLDKDLVNVYVWIDNSSCLRICVVPRSAHRPQCYGTGENDLMVSPGAIDISGIMILPREKDFDKISTSDIVKILSQTCLPNKLQ